MGILKNFFFNHTDDKSIHDFSFYEVSCDIPNCNKCINIKDESKETIETLLVNVGWERKNDLCFCPEHKIGISSLRRC